MRLTLQSVLAACLWLIGCTASTEDYAIASDEGNGDTSSDEGNGDTSSDEGKGDTSSDEGETDTATEPSLTDFDNVASVSVGTMHTCAVTHDGALWCWGSNTYGQLGDGTRKTSWTPKRIDGIPEPVIKVSAGVLHTCAITESHSLYCFGYNSLWALGIEDDCGWDATGPCVYASPQRIDSVGNDAYDAALGYSYTCILTEDGTVSCFGGNEYGTLGNGTEGYETSVSEPTPVLNLPERVTAIAAGHNHTCAALEPGGVRCWGADSSGRLGRGAGCKGDLECDNTIPDDVVDLPEKVIHLDANWWHTCAVTETHEAVCWGDEQSGAVGAHVVAEVGTPIRPLVPIEGVVEVSTGEHFSCARNEAGAVVCWGLDNGTGQLGTTETAPSFFNDVPLDSPARSLGSGMAHSCAVSEDDRVFCWGDNQFGALGDGRGGFVMTADLSSKKAVKVDTGRDYNCSLGESGVATCWGTESSLLSPITMEDIADISSDALGLSGLACSVSSIGAVQCFGDIVVEIWKGGEDGSEVYGWQQLKPSLIEGLPGDARSVSVVTYGAMVQAGDGDFYYWGHLSDGEFGVRPISDVPATKQTDGAAVLTTDGRLLQLSSDTGRAEEKAVLSGFAAAVGDIESFAVGDGFICAVNRGGGVLCTGENDHGQLGNGLTYSSGSLSDAPKSVIALPGPMSKVSAGKAHACALTTDGEAWCWGGGYMNQIGDNLFDDHPTPVSVPGATGLTDISVGYQNTCAINASGEVRCWGRFGGGLGVSDIAGFSATPVAVQIAQQ